MVDALGWLNLVLVIFMGMIYPLKKLQFKRIGKGNRGKGWYYGNLYKKMRRIHPIMGMLMIMIGIIHGYLALGEMRLHTGSLVLLALILMALTAIIGPNLKVTRIKWRSIHRGSGILLIGFLLLHLFWRSLI